MTINGRTPQEIKEQLRVSGEKDALLYIEALEDKARQHSALLGLMGVSIPEGRK